MGYEVNSPIKQVWLPLNYSWLSEYLGEEDFGTFAKVYKKTYGIDLHDLFKLETLGTNVFGMGLKEYLIGAYTDEAITHKGKFAIPNAIITLNTGSQGTEMTELLTVGVWNKNENFGWGLSIFLPVQGNEVNSIDDLRIGLYEI